MTNRKQYVAIRSGDGHVAVSGLVSSNIGVPQGTVLSPILFSLYIDGVEDCLDPTCTVTLYADDTSLIISDPVFDVLQDKCTANLRNLQDWYSDNSLYLNLQKTHYLRFHSRQRDCEPVNLVINNTQISGMKSVKFLGVEIDQHLNWDSHCSGIIAKLNSTCYLFKTLRRVLNLDQLKMLYHAQVGSRLRYAVLHWGNSPSAREVFLRQKRVIRSLLGLRPLDSCRQAFKSLKILTLTSLYILEISSYIFKCRHSFIRNKDVHNMNTRGRNNFHLEFAKLNVRRNSPEIVGLKIFNSLPDGFKNSPNIRVFRQHLKILLLENSSYDMEEFFGHIGG